MRRHLLRPATAIALVGLLAVPAGALGHVSVEPAEADAATEITATFRVPNEGGDDPTVKLDLQLPEGVDDVAPQPVPGWESSVAGRTVTWTGGRIAGEDARRFPVRLTLPGDEGELAFKVLQTYDSGKVVRWIGESGSENEAPVMTLAAAPAGAATPQPTGTPQATPSPEATAVPDEAGAGDRQVTTGEDDDGGSGLAIAGAVAGLLLVAGLMVLLVRRRGGQES